MMAFSLYINELLSPHGRIVVKRMFGGHGVYCDGLFIAILSGETLYFKTDEASRRAFEDAGCVRFSYSRAGRIATLGFYTAPAEALESRELIKPWTRLALQAALRADAKKRPQKQATSARQPLANDAGNGMQAGKDRPAGKRR